MISSTNSQFSLPFANRTDSAPPKKIPIKTGFTGIALDHHSLLEDSYRSRLDSAFAREKAKLERPCSSFVKIDRFYQVLAIEFALSAAEDVTQRLNLEAKMIDNDSQEYLCCVFACRRIKSAWGKMTGPPPRLYSAIRDRTLKLLEELSTPSDIEREISSAGLAKGVKASTDPYGDILAFLKTELG